MSDDALVAHQRSGELEVASLGAVDDMAVSVRYPMKNADRVPLGIAAFVKMGESTFTPSEARGLAALLREAAAIAEQRPVFSAIEVARLFDAIVRSAGGRVE